MTPTPESDLPEIVKIDGWEHISVPTVDGRLHSLIPVTVLAHIGAMILGHPREHMEAIARDWVALPGLIRDRQVAELRKYGYTGPTTLAEIWDAGREEES